jgi:xanthine dehydrogenase/oxidase
MAQDIPTTLDVTFLQNDSNPDGIMGSKAVGEPPQIISNSIYFALRCAVKSARCDADNAGVGVGGCFDLDVPATVDKRVEACLVNPNRFVMPC